MKHDFYKIKIAGIALNNHVIHDSQTYQIAMIDSGTTFTYLPDALFNKLSNHYDWFCTRDLKNHCLGKRSYLGQDASNICF